MTLPASSIYKGTVWHGRTRPVRHQLSYQVGYLLVDVDGLEDLSKTSRVFSYNSAGLLSIHDADHGEKGAAKSISQWARETLSMRGLDQYGHKIFLLTMPRILGYVFNPISVYYCFGEDKHLGAVLYEVHNTFGERHTYICRMEKSGRAFRASARKKLHVSPFIKIEGGYEFTQTLPGKRLNLAIRYSNDDGLLLDTTLNATRLDLSESRLAAMAFGQMLLTFKVIAAIHWQALKLWFKGVAIVPHPEKTKQKNKKLREKTL